MPEISLSTMNYDYSYSTSVSSLLEYDNASFFPQQKMDLFDYDEKETTKPLPYVTRNKHESESKRLIDRNGDQYFIKNGEFFGTIIVVDSKEEIFIALMKSFDDQYQRKIVFSFSDVDNYDRGKITVGTQIVFVYGKQYNNGTIYNNSKVFFRAPEIWTKHKLEKLRQESDFLFSLING